MMQSIEYSLGLTMMKTETLPSIQVWVENMHLYYLVGSEK